MDISFKFSNEKFNYRVCAMMISDGKILAMQDERSPYYYLPGGRVKTGETAENAVIREVKEELGLDIDNDNIIELGYLLYDRPIRFIFYLKKDIDIQSLKLQQEEVDSVEFMSIDKIKELIAQGLMLTSHAKIFNKVLEYLEGLGE